MNWPRIDLFHVDPRGILLLILIALLFLLTACAPPSVQPLMLSVERALAEESTQVAADGERIEALYEMQRGALASGFDSDLSSRPELDAEWVRRAMTAYLAAREGLLRAELADADRLATRQRNLALAREAQRRARILLESHDQLYDRLPELRAFVESLTTPTPSPTGDQP